MRFCKVLLCLASCVSLLIPALAFSQEIQTDFDGDGTSDTLLVNAESNKSLAWQYVSSVSTSNVAIGSIGSLGNHLIPAKWRGTGQPQIGIVTLDSGKKNIVWKIIDENGQTREKTFGRAKDLAISGADFDGNGVADAAVAFLSGNKVVWRIWPNMFFTDGSEESSVVKISFGTKGDRAFYASPDGAADWLGTVGKSNGRSVLRLRNIVTGEVRSSSKFGKFASQGSRPRPFPVRRSDGSDALGFEVPGSAKTTFIFTSLTGQKLGQTSFGGNATAIVGNFSSASGEEIAVSTSASWDVFNPFNLQTTSFEKKTGIPVDQINLNTLDKAFNGDDTPATPPNDGGGNDDGSDLPSTTCSSVVPWPSSHIYKTIGSEHFTDVRRNTAGVVIKPGGRGPFPGCLSAMDKNGGVIAQFGLYAMGAGWAARYYAGIGCGASTAYNGAKLASIAQSRTGSRAIYMNFGSVCYGPIDAGQCIGSGQC